MARFAAKPYVEGAPIAEGHKIHGEMSHPSPKTHAEPNGNIAISGSEYLGRVVVPAVNAGTGSVPAGGCLFYTQLSPLSFDGSRINQLSQMFEQWRFNKLVIEYVPNCPTTTAGGVVGYCTGDIQQNQSLVTGDGGVREAFSRAGSLALPVWEHGAFHMNATQQKWYYTALVGAPELTIPGSFQLIANTDFSVTTTAVQLGQVWCHYDLEFRVPSVEDTAAFSYSANNGNITFSGLTLSANNIVAIPEANFPLGASFKDMGVVGYATIVAYDDTGPGTSQWRTWNSPATGDTFTLGPGMVLFFRYQLGLNSNTWTFYPTLGDAISDVASADAQGGTAWTATISIGAIPATAGFKVGPVRGLRLGPD